MKLIRLKKVKHEASSHTSSNLLSKKVIIKNGEIPHLTQFAQGYFQPHCFVDKHKHKDMYEIFLIEKGKIEFVVNKKTLLLKSGDSIIVEPGEEHQLKNRFNRICIITYFSIIA